MLAPLDRERQHWTALAVCAASEAVVAGILLLGAPLPPAFRGPAAVAFHVMAVLLLIAWPGATHSRRWLCAAAVLTLPGVGVGVAAVVHGTRGRGSVAMGPPREAPPPLRLGAAAAHRLGSALSPCDALDSGDEEQRRAALSALARRSDPEALTVLRWAAAGRDPDLALCAALALDEIHERAERLGAPPLDAVEVRNAAA